jgi:hypothetical protein
MVINYVEIMNCHKLIFLFHYPGYAANLPVVKLYFNAAGVVGGAGEQAFHKATGKCTVPLIFLQYNINLQAGVYIASVLSVHK